jgi:hypothetical protein
MRDFGMYSGFQRGIRSCREDVWGSKIAAGGCQDFKAMAAQLGRRANH